MATGERITAEARGALVHLPRQPEAEPLHDPRQGDVDEWGRSEHIRQLARRLYDPLYRQLFRVEWEGLEKIPTDGGALLVANHAGAIPSDAPVIMHGVEEELQRPVYGLADQIFKAMPIVYKNATLAKMFGLPYVPLTANMLLLGPLGLVAYFPSKFKLRVLDPVHFDVPPDQERYSRSRIMDEAEAIRVSLQDNLYEMLRQRRSVWFG